MRRKLAESWHNGDGFGDTMLMYAGDVYSGRPLEVRYQNEVWGDSWETAFNLQLTYEDVGE